MKEAKRSEREDRVPCKPVTCEVCLNKFSRKIMPANSCSFLDGALTVPKQQTSGKNHREHFGIASRTFRRSQHAGQRCLPWCLTCTLQSLPIHTVWVPSPSVAACSKNGLSSAVEIHRTKSGKSFLCASRDLQQIARLQDTWFPEHPCPYSFQCDGQHFARTK